MSLRWLKSSLCEKLFKQSNNWRESDLSCVKLGKKNQQMIRKHISVGGNDFTNLEMFFVRNCTQVSLEILESQGF